MADWRTAVLQALGAKPTKQNLRFLDTWQRWEGGHTKNDARFNWLNTTKAAPGAVRSINSVGVKAFASFQHGVQATAATLMNGRYDDIVAGLLAGNPYKFKPSAGLQTWVSGRPDGNPGYALKILGGKAGSQPLPSPAAPSRARPGSVSLVDTSSDLWATTMDIVFGKKHPEFAEIMKTMPPDALVGEHGPTAPPYDSVPKANGKTLQPGASWRGSHVTDGLDWNGGRATATDIMAKPGTAVLAPESGHVVRWGSAQGGEALYFMSDSGHLYWLGHITGMAPIGAHVEKGGKLALVSPDHPRPHLHIDRYYGTDPGRYT